MNAHIEQIGVIDKLGANHIVYLKEGVNIITGRSSTGKSALIEIFDYCFGSSEFTIPDGVITRHAEIYFVLLKLKNSRLLLGRRNKSSKAFIKEFDESFFVNNSIGLQIFQEHNFLTLVNFNKELGGYFGINITDTELEANSSFHRGKKKPSPSIRSFMSYMLQHQNLIANKHAVFYRFDEKEKKEQAIEHFMIFLGLVDQEYFLISQRLDIYKSQLRKLELSAPRVDELRKRIKLRIVLLLEEYEAVAGCSLNDITVDKAYVNPARCLNVLQNTEIKIDSSSNKNNSFIELKEKERNETIIILRKEEKMYRDLCSSISSMNIYQRMLIDTAVPIEVTEHVTKCPLCSVESEMLEEETNALADAIDWLNSELKRTPFVHKSFLSKKSDFKNKISIIKDKLKLIDEQITNIEKTNKDLVKRNSISEQLIKIKLKLETYLENLLENKAPDELDEQIKLLRKKIKDEKEHLSSYKLEETIKELETFINSNMRFIGEKLDFESDYQPINLKFSLETFDIYHEPLDDKSKKIFLRSMGSGANWLYTHLSLFLSLQALFCKFNKSCLIPPILFIDQPTQVYFPNVTSDNKTTFNANDMIGNNEVELNRVDDDIKSVERFFDEIITFCDNVKTETSVLPQVIIIDHADNLELSKNRDFEDYVVARWRTRGFIDL
jgi:hypothetical protein